MPGEMLKRLAKRAAWLVVVSALTLLAVRAFDSQRGPPLEVWHTVVPKELTADEIAGTDWQGYLAAEDAAFEEVRTRVTRRLDPKDRVPANRYFEDSPVYPGRFAQDWNRSFVLEPDGPAQGAVVLLHGLTDAPYSMRQVARSYRDRGFVAVVPRLPGHGTVPAGLSKVQWEDWAAATRLAVREAMRRAGPGRPLHVVGYSNGGALAVKYALDAIEDPGLTPPTRIVLISPMIGITEMARFAGFAGLPAIFPPFAKAAWLGIVPEFNPFKYNSFPVNGARQSSLLTRALQPRVVRLAREGRLAELAPVLTFQSATDFTVSTAAVVDALYAHLPANGSERRATAADRAAALPDDGGDERGHGLLRGGRARHRGRRTSGDRSAAGPALSDRRLLALAHCAAVSRRRSRLRPRARSRRGLRRAPRRHRAAGRARHARRQPGCARPDFVEPVLSVSVAAHRGGDSRRSLTVEQPNADRLLEVCGCVAITPDPLRKSLTRKRRLWRTLARSNAMRTVRPPHRRLVALPPAVGRASIPRNCP